MLFRTLVVFLVLVLPGYVLAQDQVCLTISGSVTSSVDGEPLAGVHVFIDGAKMQVTNKIGQFASDCLEGGDYDLALSHLGFRDNDASTTVSSQSRVLVFEMLATELELGEVLVLRSGLFGSKNIRDLPGSTHLLTPRDLQRFKSSDIHKSLASIPGVYIQEEDGYGLRPNIGMRGTGLERSSKITIMEDGVLIAPAPYSASAAYYFPSVGRMHSIEVRKGSSQIKYGPQTTGGALNLVSTPIPNKLTGKVDWLFGSDKYYQVHANLGTSFKHGAFLLETLQHGSDGFKKPDYHASAGFQKQDYLAKLKLKTPDTFVIPQAVIFKVASMDENADETYLGLNSSDFNANPYRRYSASQLDNITSEHRQAQMQHIAKLGEGLSLSSTLYQNEFERDWFKLDYLRDADGNKIKLGDVLSRDDDPFISLLRGERSSATETLGLKHNNRSYYSRGIQSTLLLSSKDASWIEEAEFGFRLHQDEMDRFQWVDTYLMSDSRLQIQNAGIPGTESNRIESAKALSFHLQSKHRLGLLSLTPGMRYELAELRRLDYGKLDVDRIGDDISSRTKSLNALVPGIGFDYSLTSDSRLFGGIHRGFSPPGSSEGSKPELSLNYEMGYRGVEGNTHYELIGFLSDYSNLLGSDLAASGGNGTTELFNGGQAKVLGLEALAKRDFGNLVDWRLSLPFELSYTLSRAEFEHSFSSSFEAWGDVSKGDILPYLPKHKLSLDMGFQTKNWDTFIRLSYTSRMRFVAGQERLNNSNSTDDPLLISLSSSYQLTSKFNLFAKVDNLTDQVYIVANRPFGLRPGAPRRGSVGIRAML